MVRIVALALVVTVGCTPKGPRPTITGAALYAKVETLRATGAVTVAASNGREIEVKNEHFLIAPKTSQVFVVGQVTESCKGGQLDDDVDCALALLRDQRFVVQDAPPQPRDTDDPKDLGDRTKVLLAGVAIAGPLTYGVVACEHDACKMVFGILLGVDLFVVLMATVGLK